MTIDTKKWNEALRRDAAWQGERCQDARSNPDGDIIAAAIAVTQLVYLRSLAAHKKLSDRDIQTAIDAFMDGANMTEARDRMGGPVFVRNPTVRSV
jgi:hypothetical protein